MADTPAVTPWELDSAGNEPHESTADGDSRNKWLNFSNQEAKSKPRFTPAVGSHNFWHNGNYFQVNRKEISMFDDSSSSLVTDKETLTLTCYGRSPEPIKQLLQHAREQYHQGRDAKTIIKRPAGKDMRRFGGRGSWVKIAERPCRPINTVVLDEALKLEVLTDINEYLSPATARWVSLHAPTDFRRFRLLTAKFSMRIEESHIVEAIYSMAHQVQVSYFFLLLHLLP